MLTQRDIAVLSAVAHYYTLTRQQIQQLCFPSDPDGRVTRKRLQRLVDDKLLNRTNTQVVNPRMGFPAPVYFPSRKLCETLRVETGDEKYLAVCTDAPNWQHLCHWVEVAEMHIRLDQAAARAGDVQVEEWLGEWAIANPREQAPENRYKLFTLIRSNPRLVCAPDAAFVLAKGGFRKVFYLEVDRATSGIAQVAASKTPGYAAMAESKLHWRHFPATAERFLVLLTAPDAKRRDALRRAIAAKPGNHLWKFAAASELTAETFLNSAVWHPCEGDPEPLVRPSAKPAGAVQNIG